MESAGQVADRRKPGAKRESTDHHLRQELFVDLSWIWLAATAIEDEHHGTSLLKAPV
jgi:hypothetical protein